MEDKVVVLSTRRSAYGMRVPIALGEKGVQYEYVEQDLDDKSPLLLQMNPIHKKVPVLIHNGKPICESPLILQYIDEVWNQESPLLPSNPYQRAQVKFWTDYVDKKIFVSGRDIVCEQGEKQELAAKQFVEGLKTMEGELGDKPYFGGNAFGFLDVALIPAYPWLYVLEILGNFNVEAECPKLIAWAKRCAERESVAKILPHHKKIYDFTLQRRKKLGLE